MSVISRLPVEGATLLVLADPRGGLHYAYATARRTLCLEVMTVDCEVARELEGPTCPTCEAIRRKLSRRRRDW